METPQQVNDGLTDHRRKWDLDEFEKIAVKRYADDLETEDEQPVKKRESLKQRDYKVDLQSRIGKSVVVTKNTPASKAGGYHCNVCDCVVKDSINFLDHINGKKHQRNLGMSMNIKRSSLDDVKARFETNKLKLTEQKKKYDLKTRLKELEDEEQRAKEYKKGRQAQKKKQAAESSASSGIGDIDPEMTAMMGFSGFGSSKL